ncbi:MAG: DUF4349 domain-containing protein [Myxococcota bacterium]
MRLALFAAFLLTGATSPETDRSTAKQSSVKPLVAVQNSVVLKVGDREQAADAVVEQAEKVGGYFSSRSDTAVTLKVPAKSAPQILSFIEESGIVVDRNYNARDVGFALEEKRARLRSREEVLKRYFAVMQTAGVKNIVSVEREMTTLVQEIETLKGQLKLIEHQLSFAEIRVDFQFRDRRPPLRTGNSNFQWLNTVNLADLIQGFSQ